MARLIQDDTNFGDRAPAVEALIDIRIEGSIDLDDLRELSDSLSVDFPEVQTQFEFRGKLEFRKNEATSLVEHQGIRGFLRKNAESVVQLRRDGFTYSKLAPYTRWDAVSAAARDYWSQYVERAKPERVRRLAVRYINHIHPPKGWQGSAEWLHIAVSMPDVPGIPREPADFFIRVLQPHPTEKHAANVTVATVKDDEERRILLFDIDVFQDADLACDDIAIWKILADQRDYKNDIFFGSITARTRELLR